MSRPPSDASPPREQVILREVARELAASETGQDVLSLIVANALSIAGGDGAYVERIDLSRRAVEVLAGAGEGTPPVGSRVPFPGSVAEEVIEQGTPEVIESDELARRPIGATIERSCGRCSAIVVPLLSGGDALGALVVLRREGRERFVQEEVERIRILCNMAALALRRAVLLWESKRQMEARERLTGILEAATDLISTADPTGRVLYLNRTGRRMLGLAEGEKLPALTIGDLHPPEEYDRLMRVALPTAEREGSWRGETWLRTAEGQVPVSQVIVAHRDPSGELEYFSTIMRDISERRKAEEERRQALESLRRSEERQAYLAEAGRVLASSLDYEQTLKSVAELMVPRVADWCVVDVMEKEGEVTRMEIAVADPENAELAREYDRRFPPRLDAEEGVSKVLRTGEPELFERIPDSVLKGVARDEEQLEFLRKLELCSAMIVPMVARGRTLGAVTLVTSESQRCYGSEDLEFAQRLAERAALSVEKARLYREAQRATQARDDVLAIVSHDLRNPLGTIAMSAGFMLETSLPEEKRRGQLEIIKRSADRMANLIRDLLDVASLESGSFAVERFPTRASELVAEVCEMLRSQAEARKISLECSVEEGLPLVSVDRDRVLQVLSNLVGNAIKFTDAGGRVEVRAAHVGKWIRLTVADTGVGIDAEDIPRLFDRFWQAKNARRGGAGLGLAIARGIVAAHGGEVGVESTLGEGSTFWFTVPVHEREGTG